MAKAESPANKDDFIEKLVAVNRVAKVVKGGRQFGFTALLSLEARFLAQNAHGRWLV